MDLSVKILFVVIMALEELFFRYRLCLESFDKIVLMGLNGDRLGWVDEDWSISEMVKFLDKGTDGSVSIVEICHGWKFEYNC